MKTYGNGQRVTLEDGQLLQSPPSSTKSLLTLGFLGFLSAGAAEGQMGVLYRGLGRGIVWKSR
jgi:hypothetical protein